VRLLAVLLRLDVREGLRLLGRRDLLRLAMGLRLLDVRERLGLLRHRDLLAMLLLALRHRAG
jgi:hypothetical protein